MEKGEDMNTIRWKMPDQYLTEWYRNLSGAVKTAFYAAFAAGLAAHLYQFTNKLYNYKHRTGKMAVKLDGAFYAFCIWRFLFTAFF